MSPAEPAPARRLLPAWSLGADGAEAIPLPTAWPERVTREWAWGGSTGEGVRVCILDSGVDADHPLVGGLAAAVAVQPGEGDALEVVPDTEGDACGHGTACAGIVRRLAPACELGSARVLGAGYRGSGRVLLEGLRWAIDEGYDVVNMSLSTSKRELAATLHELADRAYFRRCVIVAAAHNMPVESFPWRFASVVSVGSHEEADPLVFYANPQPPVELFAHGVDVEVAWTGGSTLRCTGNSFAAPHVAGICALVLGKHPGLTPFELKSILRLTATNVGGGT